MGGMIDITPVHYIKTTSGKQLFKFHSYVFHGTSGSPYMETHCSDSACIELIKSGRGVLSETDHTWPLAPGDVMILRSMAPHSIRAVSDGDSVEIVGIDFNLTQILGLISEFMDSRITRILLSLDDAFQSVLHQDAAYVREIGAILLGMEKDFLGDVPDHNVAIGKFLTVLSLIAGNVPLSDTRLTKIHKKYDRVIARSIEYISQNLTTPLTLDSIAAQTAMDPYHYGKVFREIYGITPWNYVLRARVELAMRYLKETTTYYSVTEAAALAGFSNLSNFNRVFKRHTGMTPSAFRGKP